MGCFGVRAGCPGVALAVGLCLLPWVPAYPASGTDKILYSFEGPDGERPSGGLVADSTGALFGVTYGGGAAHRGTVFRLAPPATLGGVWTLTTIYSFPAKGGYVYYAPGLAIGANGTLYGTADEGGLHRFYGVVFSLTPPPPGATTWTYATVHAFAGGANDGAQPGGVTVGPDGALYGGTALCELCNPFVPNEGTVWRIAEVNGTWTEQVLFTAPPDAPPAGPADFLGRVWVAADGSVYGTSALGPAGNAGTVWKLAPPTAAGGAYSMSILYSGDVGGDLIVENPASIYTQSESTLGAVLHLTLASPGAAWTADALAYFDGLGGKYLNPGLALIGGDQFAFDTLYGSTQGGGGRDGYGLVFRLTPSFVPGAWLETVKHVFRGGKHDGAVPGGPLLVGQDYLHPHHAVLYGVTAAGGAHDKGTIYSVHP